MFLDLKLPTWNGFEVLSQIRQDEKCKRLICIVVSSSSDQNDINQAYEIGANCDLVKPIDFRSLQQSCKTLLAVWLILCEAPDRTPLSRHDYMLRRAQWEATMPTINQKTAP
jgi:DNA-binding response OmpR family regulator